MPGLLSNYLSNARSKRTMQYLKGDVLDIGCGPAKNYQLAIDHNLPVSSYTGIEYSLDQVKQLKVQYPEASFYSVDLDEENLPLHQPFDTIILLAVIEHIFNLKFLFKQLFKLLKDDGRIVLTTPTPFGNDIVHKLGTKVGLFNKEGGQDDHIVIFNRKRLEILAEEMNLKIESYRTFQFRCNQIIILKKDA